VKNSRHKRRSEQDRLSTRSARFTVCASACDGPQSGLCQLPQRVRSGRSCLAAGEQRMSTTPGADSAPLKLVL